MKRKIFLLAFIVLSLCVILLFTSSCGEKKFTVTFDSDGGTEVGSQEVIEGDRIKKPEDPTKMGFEFMGWYYSDEKWSFTEHFITGDITLKAKWSMNGLLFSNNGTYAKVVGYEGLAPDVVIPQTFNDMPVKEIADGAFRDNKILSSITFPSSLLVIGKNAFENCTLLKSITIPQNVISIGTNAFSGCFKLVEVFNFSYLDITKGNSSNGYIAFYAKAVHKSREQQSLIIEGDNGYFFFYDGNEYSLIDYQGTEKNLTLPSTFTGIKYTINRYAFYESNIESVIIPNGVTSIGRYAFGDCSSISNVTFGKDITTIESGAFEGCLSLTSITLPQSIKKIDPNAFFRCSNLKNVTLEKNNSWYVSRDQNSTTTIPISKYEPEEVARYLTSIYYSYYWYN